MQTRHVFVSSLCVMFLACATLVAGDSKGKEEGKSARDDKDFNPKEAVVKKGQDLNARVDALEHQVRELVASLKGHKESVGDKVAAFKKASGPSDDAYAHAMKEKMKAAAEAKQAIDKKPSGEGKGDDGPQVIKGPDGQLYVRLSALPPEFRKKFGGNEKEHGVIDQKPQSKTKKQEKDDDDRTEGKKPGKPDKD